MLLIGDIHITAKWSDEILSQIENFINQFPDENSVVFLGDYVYHFNYERKSLLKLFQLFVSLLQEGKSVYVLAGNHDWIAEHFVYEEAKQAFDVLQHTATFSGKLHFITQPEFVQIEGKDILFFPFTNKLTQVDILPEYQFLSNSSHHGDILSAKVNSLLQRLLATWRQKQDRAEKLVVFHHRYIAKTIFPGQQAMFSYKSPALDQKILDEEDIQLVSGHLHRPFSLKNYLCTGSVRYTSPLEFNQLKYLFRWRHESHLDAYQVAINPYVRLGLEENDSLNSVILKEKLDHVRSEQAACFLSPARTIATHDIDKGMFSGQLSVIVESRTLTYEELGSYVDQDLLSSLYDLRIKQPHRSVNELTDELLSASLELGKSISDRKTLLKEYIHKKFGEESSAYESLLYDLNIL